MSSKVELAQQPDKETHDQIILPVEPPSVEDIVDGGRAAWCTAIGGSLAVATTFGYANSFGVYQDLYTRSNTASASAISWIGSTQLFFLLAGALPGGKLLDMGYFRHTTLVGSIIYVFCLFMVSLCDPQKYYQLYLAQGLGMGIGSGLLYVPALAVQSHHWRARRAFAMGIVASGSSIGGLIFPIILNQLFKSSLGFEWGVRISAFVVLAMLIGANLLMTPKEKFKSTSSGDRPDIKGIMTDGPYLLTILGMFFGNWGVFIPYFYLQLFAILHGVSPTTAFYLITILNGAAIPGRIFPNMLADYLGPFNTITPVLLACGVLIYALIGISTAAGIIVFAILYGFMSGAALSLVAPGVAVLAKHPSEIGIRFGLAFSLSGFGALVGSPVTGALLGSRFAWTNAIAFNGASMTVSFIFLIIVRQILVKRRGSQII
ncbi:unnamed protein product [Cyclocybe aegerita]|uniref:Major facilitator superfamily (MFS) profile domain-containing protein n=1 Tax=Cyclocybe aegerita TaxID=1973307 RepID=A0A8S0WI71_CYCAE|nr:unnamed protein product [Cyclocybe aegerita]